MRNVPKESVISRDELQRRVNTIKESIKSTEAFLYGRDESLKMRKASQDSLETDLMCLKLELHKLQWQLDHNSLLIQE